MSSASPGTPQSNRGCIPRATYRLQFNRDFTFKQATGILGYLEELGISDVYASPLFQAQPDSTHGYDVCSFEKLNSQIGSEGEFERLCSELHRLNLGLLLDMVPNHMSASLSNAWWFDVLEKGPESPFASYFDIDWRPANPSLQGKVLLPVLEDRYATVLASGKLELRIEAGRFFIGYYNAQFPVAIPTLPPNAANAPEAVLSAFKGKAGNSRSFAQLDALIQRQYYRLAYWKTASAEINYRRFFDISKLAGLKMENADVFAATHRLVFDWLRAGKLSGLRIDHPDGLRDPKQYFERLQSAASQSGQSLYIVIEKILSPPETLPTDWPVSGTTGYDFLNYVNGLFIAGENEPAFDTIYRDFTGQTEDFSRSAYESKKHILETSFVSDLNSLVRLLWNISEMTYVDSDFTSDDLKCALIEVIAAFPVYRTYRTDGAAPFDHDVTVINQAFDEARTRNPEIVQEVFDFLRSVLRAPLQSDTEPSRSINEFVMRFQQLTGPVMAKGMEDTAFYNFNRLISLNEVGGNPERFGVTPKEFHDHNTAIASTWPNTLLATTTHDTKRGEDARTRIDVLSELPDLWNAALARWSEWNAEKKTQLSGQPAPSRNDEYLFYQSLLGALPFDCDQSEIDESFLNRLSAFMLKAIKEAKRNTSWTEPNADYEAAVTNFVERILSSDSGNRFLEDFRVFHRRVASLGKFNSLAQTLLKITSPGVPDFYQGTELWDFSFVDPDNRRSVDFEKRRQILRELKDQFAAAVGKGNGAQFLTSLLEKSDSGEVKLWVIWRALQVRRKHAEIFAGGDYVPLLCSGARKSHVVAFARSANGRCLIIVVPRLVYGLSQEREALPVGKIVWEDTVMILPDFPPGARLRNHFTEETWSSDERERNQIPLRWIFGLFPVALLEVLAD